MKIAVISSFLPTASKTGVGYQVDLLANTLVARGHEIVVFSPAAKPPDARYAHVLVSASGRFRTIARSYQLRHYDWAGFDVIHAHDDDWLMGRHEQVPRVRTMHGTCLQEAVHVKGVRHKVRTAWLAFLETGSCLFADHVIAVSSNTCRVYRWIGEVIPNGVNLEQFSPGKKDDAPVIMFVGTYHHRKRGRLLMDVFARHILPALPDAQLWMVCNDAPNAPNVHVLGSLSNKELADRYRRATVFCLPSSYEGFGIPYIEAMANGTAVVATENPGAVEVLAGGKYGVLAEVDNLGSALLQVLTNNALRAELERGGLTRSAAFDINHVAAKYEAIYHAQRSSRRVGAAQQRLATAGE